MPHYFSIMIDKSVLQGLTVREAEWLFHHYRVNVPPVFFAELIADIHKGEKGTSTGSGEGDAKMLAAKVDAAFIDLNEEANRIVEMELRGFEFPMDGRPLIPSERVRMPDGSFGAYIDQTPMQRVVERWKDGKFDEMEKEFAKVWREHVSALDLEELLRRTKNLRDKERNTPEAVAEFVDRILFKEHQNFSNLMNWMEIVGVHSSWVKPVIERWKGKGRPDARQFAPYTAYMARLKLYFFVAVGHHVITTRKSNKIDLDYFMYLPFVRVFSSSDKIHAEHFGQFARPNQTFIEGGELKACLREMADYYDNLAEEEKQQGSFTYADYPPVHMDNAITRTYDKYIPKWRDGANQPSPPRDSAADAKVMAALKPVMDALRAHKDRKQQRT